MSAPQDYEFGPANQGGRVVYSSVVMKYEGRETTEILNVEFSLSISYLALLFFSVREEKKDFAQLNL